MKTPSYLRLTPLALVVLCALATAGTASAQFPLGFGAFGGWGRGSSVHDGERIPYFAAHPPVYYSQAVPRPYGYSPYPLLPGQHPAEPVATSVPTTVAPKVILNPFVPSATTDRTAEEDDSDADAAPPADRQASRGGFILNPYVVATTPTVEVASARISGDR